MSAVSSVSSMSSMSSMAAGKLADYHAAVAQFQAASLGAYPGPSTPFDFLQQKIGAVDGLNPQELITGTKAAVGPVTADARGGKTTTGGRGIGGFFLEMATGVLGSFGGGALLGFFDKLATDDEEDDQQCRNLVKDSEQCAETIEDICTTSDTAMSEILEPATHLISILTQFIRRTPMGSLASAAVSVAGNLIEDTNEQIIGTCQDRDDSVEKCYEEFLRRCDGISERPLPCEPPETTECPLPVQPAGEHTCEPPPKEVEPCPEEPAPKDTKPVGTKPVDTKPVETAPGETKPIETKPVESKPAPETPKPQPETPPSKTPNAPESKDCDKPKQKPEPKPEPKPKPKACPPPEPECVEEPTKPAQPSTPPEPTVPAEPPASEEPCVPEDSCEPSTSCCGILGLLGVGVAIVGLGALMWGIAECLENIGDTPEPEPEPEPEPKPKPQPEDLSKVPEPTPPPKKLSAVSGAADVHVDNVPSAQANAQPAPQPTPQQTQEPQASSAGSAAAQSTPSSPARKAGAW